MIKQKVKRCYHKYKYINDNIYVCERCYRAWDIADCLTWDKYCLKHEPAGVRHEVARRKMLLRKPEIEEIVNEISNDKYDDVDLISFGENYLTLNPELSRNELKKIMKVWYSGYQTGQQNGYFP